MSTNNYELMEQLKTSIEVERRTLSLLDSPFPDKVELAQRKKITTNIHKLENELSEMEMGSAAINKNYGK